MEEEPKESSAKTIKFSVFRKIIDSIINPFRKLNKFSKILVLIIFFFLICFISLFEFSTSPRFCRSCHIMEPYYKAWKTSRHNFVPCVECHYPPGRRDELWVKFQAMTQVVKYVTRTYGSKPYADIEDASCLRKGCHATRLLQGKIIFKRGIVFNHTPHLMKVRRGRHLRCTSCHSQIVIGTHMVVTESTCFLCHFKGTKHGRVENPIGGCPSCHQAPKEDIKIRGVTFNHRDFVTNHGVTCQKCHLDAIQGEGEAPKERCFVCHNQPEKLQRYGDLAFLHDNHVTKHDVACFRCHEEIKHSVQTSVKPLEYGCDVCHEAKHSVQKEMFMGVSGKDFPSIPSHMYITQVDCIACHIMPTEPKDRARLAGQTFKASETACIGCHGRKYEGMLKSWKDTFDKMLSEIQPKFQTVSAITKNKNVISSQNRQTVNQLFQDAKYNIDFVTIGRGVHNVFYAAGLLQVANGNLDKVLKILNRPSIQLKKFSFLSGDYCAVLCHNRAGVKPPQEVIREGAKLPHMRHFSEFGVTCTSCHSAQHHKEVTVKKADCMNCHHSSQNSQCSNCHYPQASFYKGTVKAKGISGLSPNLMAEKVNCIGCHNLSVKHSKGAVAVRCISCHEKSYAQILDDWEKSTAELLNKTSASIQKANGLLASVGRTRQDVTEAKKLLDEAQTNFNIVKKAKGVHNPDLAEQLLNSAQEKSGKAFDLLKSSPSTVRRTSNR